jgi:hypothetical protein
MSIQTPSLCKYAVTKFTIHLFPFFSIYNFYFFVLNLISYLTRFGWIWLDLTRIIQPLFKEVSSHGLMHLKQFSQFSHKKIVKIVMPISVNQLIQMTI